MKKAIGILVVIVLLVVAGCVSAETAPAFAWNMSKVEVDRMLNTEGRVDEETGRAIASSGSQLVVYENQPVSEFNSIMGAIFQYDQLVARFYYLGDYSAESTFRYLENALDKLYGSPNNSPEVLPDLLVKLLFVGSRDLSKAETYKAIDDLNTSYLTWKVSDDMSVTLLSTNMDFGHNAIILFYGQPKTEEYNLSGL